MKRLMCLFMSALLVLSLVGCNNADVGGSNLDKKPMVSGGVQKGDKSGEKLDKELVKPEDDIKKHIGLEPSAEPIDLTLGGRFESYQAKTTDTGKAYNVMVPSFEYDWESEGVLLSVRDNSQNRLEIKFQFGEKSGEVYPAVIDVTIMAIEGTPDSLTDTLIGKYDSDLSYMKSMYNTEVNKTKGGVLQSYSDEQVRYLYAEYEDAMPIEGYDDQHKVCTETRIYTIEEGNIYRDIKIASYYFDSEAEDGTLKDTVATILEDVYTVYEAGNVEVITAGSGNLFK